MKHLNDIPGFQWAAFKAGNGYGKVCLCHESFWIEECVERGDGVVEGVVANFLLAEEDHGLKYGDRVTFKYQAPTELYGGRQ